MTTLYEVDELERQNSHLVGELKDAERMLKELMEIHMRTNRGQRCSCHLCADARAWLARNKQA